jgi:hypothetical protein
MVNCAKCGTPNPDSAALCLACGAPLEGQKFAQALDRATSSSSASWPAVQVPSAARSSETAAPSSALAPATLAPIDSAAQAEINQYIAQSTAKKKRRQLLFALSGVVALLAAGLYFYSKTQMEQREQQAAEFLSAFLNVDDGAVADFWRCATRARREDVHRAKDNLVVMSRLERAFQAAPQKQPDHLRLDCLPKLEQAKQQLERLDPPDEFKAPLTHMKQQLVAIRQSTESYIERLNKAKQLASNEQAIIEAAQAFHDPSGVEETKAVGYVNLLRCAVKNFSKIVRSVRRPPDSQGVVEHIYTACKADPSYANTLRLECFDRLSTTRQGSTYRLARRRIAGDSRDISAIKHCFNSANRDLFKDELNAVGKSWVEYRNAVKRVVNRVAAYKPTEGGHQD